MHTEYNSQNVLNQNIETNEVIYHNSNENNDGNKFLSVLWKILLVIIVFSVLFLSLIQFGVISLASSVVPDTVVLNQNEIGIKKGKGYQLVTTVLPVNASNKQVVYESSDSTVASVNPVTGYITALKDGTAVITAKTLINEKVTECVVNVGNVNIPVSSLNIKEKNINLAAGYSETLSYSVLPSNATEINLNFTSSDSSVAKVDSKGVVTGVKAGNAVITVATNNNIVTDVAYVTVYKKGTTTVVEGETVKIDNYPKKVNIPSEKNISLGAEVQLETTITPESSIDTLSFSSSNLNVATVTNDGVVKAVGTGSADIVVKTINNLTSVCHVTVGNFSIKLKKIYITTRYSYLQVGMKKKLFMAYEPINASNPSVTWTSSNPNVVSVDSAGNIVAKTVGSAKITVQSVDGTFKDEMDIDVGGADNIVELSNMSLPKSTTDLYIGSTEQITPKFDPSDATYKTVTYISSDPNIASVDSNGQVKGLKEGKATITVRVNRSNNISANMVVNVKNKSSISVELNKTAVTILENDTDTLIATVKPSNASNKTVTYTSSDPNIATVDQSGVIKAISKGTTTITVTPNGGGTSSTCLVTIS